jgi:hypothetical protein
LLLWAFQSRKKQLQAIYRHGLRSSPLRVSEAQGQAFGCHFNANHGQSLLICSSLSVTLAARLMSYQSAYSVTHPLRLAACILSRRHEWRGRLGRVAAAAEGAGCARVIGSGVAGNGQFNRPFGGVAFDGDGNLVVCDGKNSRIQVLRYTDGTHLRSIGSEGTGNGQFKQPWSIAFDGAGHIVVSERGNHRVQVLRYSDGAHVRTIGSSFGLGNGQFFCPKGIAVDGEGNVDVCDSGNSRVQVHRLSDGACMRTICNKGSGIAQFLVGDGGVAFDSEGNLVIADNSNHRVQVLRYSDGAHVRRHRHRQQRSHCGG